MRGGSKRASLALCALTGLPVLSRALIGASLWALAASAAHAQVKPRFFIAFDTSGSMAWALDGSNTSGDGVGRPDGMGGVLYFDCATTTAGRDLNCDGLPNDSRIWIAKEAIRSAILAYGDVEWALGRFHQNQGPGINGVDVNGIESCPQGNIGCPSTSRNTNYNGDCSGGDILVGFPAIAPFLGLDNTYSLLKWMDNVETNFVNDTTAAHYCNHLGAGDCELRPDGPTPLEGILASSRNYLLPIRMSDPVASCRGYNVILLTDGEETCSGSPATEAAALLGAGIKTYVVGLAIASSNLNQIAASGGTGTAYFAGDQAQLSAALAQIVADSLLTEVCNGMDDDCDAKIDEGFTLYCNRPAGMPAPTLCTEPSETLCDGMDDDCDGKIDEGLLNACGRCPGGVEVCDGLDNDCDMKIDEGVCSCFPEVCNGKDDDCDMKIDEGLMRDCGFNLGYCTAGIEVCAAGVWGPCSGRTPTIELCDGVDNNCDGVPDDMTRPCGIDVGQCKPGTERCLNGVWGDCVGQIGPMPEVCNGKDDDCDTRIDEGLGVGEACPDPSVMVCRRGVKHCVGGQITCMGVVPAMPEICDCRDNDCDGKIDENVMGALCPGDSSCFMCQCALPCRPSEFGFTCPTGKAPIEDMNLCFCVGEVCKPDECRLETVQVGPEIKCAPAGDQGTCVCKNNMCTHNCDGVRCPPGELCDPTAGSCTLPTCNVFGCPPGESCDARTGACVPDPCAGVPCPAEQVCQRGRCRPSCARVMCPPGQSCADGVCMADPCAGIRCEASQVCNPLDGSCVPNLCNMACGSGFVCDPFTGECRPDPCLQVHCPDGEECKDGRCIVPPVAGPGGGRVGSGGSDRVVATGGGGCTCAVALGKSSDSGPWTWLLGLGGLGWAVMRRRRGARYRAGSALVLLAGAVTAAGTSGCKVDTFCLDCGDPGDAGLHDAGFDASFDASFDAGPKLDADAAPPPLPPECLRKEVCNGLDEDCDGKIDEGFDLLRDPANCGVCGNVCAPDHAFGECMAGACTIGTCDIGFVNLDMDPNNGCEYRCDLRTPPEEVCNGLDDDCDGKIDEGAELTDPQVGQMCGITQGACVAGVMQCLDGFVTCIGRIDPIVEICDGIDNDCDGVVDNGFFLQVDLRNCGSCNSVCAFANAHAVCDLGQCKFIACKSGFTDANSNPADGCELQCSITGPERCDGVDNDCDARIDEQFLVPPGFCNNLGVCASGAPACTAGQLQCAGLTPGLVYQPMGESLCDGQDNDCDGNTDEGYPVGQPCANGIGACERTGHYVCAAGGNSVLCDAAAAGNPVPELCNGQDDDCDGRSDELDNPATPQDEGIGVDDIDAVLLGNGVLIMRHEGSRPDATATFSGSSTDLACSQPAVVPWTNVNWDQASAACCALNFGGQCAAAGWRLCDAADWVRACTGQAGTCRWAYGTNCNLPLGAGVPQACNGLEHDCNAATPANENCVAATGSFPDCRSDWGALGSVFDLSGNVKEWTQTEAAPSAHEIRGGSYNNPEPGRRCDFDFTVADRSFRFPNTGFRCCYYP
ncbi:MAG: SUMF1/EgtB/PvdO family nonheme iron enzyme [Proteobacteria bacterium]|nr:SUMF1/EgtB/PvdO family nonheme iron enzyme [Pseudomonadota bacterium]